MGTAGALQFKIFYNSDFQTVLNFPSFPFFALDIQGCIFHHCSERFKEDKHFKDHHCCVSVEI